MLFPTSWLAGGYVSGRPVTWTRQRCRFRMSLRRTTGRAVAVGTALRLHVGSSRWSSRDVPPESAAVEVDIVYSIGFAHHVDDHEVAAQFRGSLMV